MTYFRTNKQVIGRHSLEWHISSIDHGQLKGFWRCSCHQQNAPHCPLVRKPDFLTEFDDWFKWLLEQKLGIKYESR